MDIQVRGTHVKAVNNSIMCTAHVLERATCEQEYGDQLLSGGGCVNGIYRIWSSREGLAM